MKKNIFIAITCVLTCAFIAACGSESANKAETKEKQTMESTVETTDEETKETETEKVEEKSEGIDYLALVNKLNELPDGWEESLETVTVTNSLGDEVEVEKKAYDAYLELKTALETEGVYVDLDSARRSVEAQQKIMDDFTEEYGEAYAIKTVATPGYSEHHTGLALDLYLNIDGKDVYLNEDMVLYTDVWAKIHEKLADYGFILRYLDNREYITGYGYEPWHIRYVDDVDIAKEIMEKDITLEEYLGAVKSSDEVTVDLGKSNIYSEEEIKEAAIQVKCKFATFEGCEFHSLTYAGDDAVNDDNLSWVNSLNEGDEEYVDVIEFKMNFHTPTEEIEGEAWDLDTEMEDYQWWLARTKDGDWEVVNFGY